MNVQLYPVKIPGLMYEERGPDSSSRSGESRSRSVGSFPNRRSLLHTAGKAAAARDPVSVRANWSIPVPSRMFPLTSHLRRNALSCRTGGTRERAPRIVVTREEMDVHDRGRGTPTSSLAIRRDLDRPALVLLEIDA